MSFVIFPVFYIDYKSSRVKYYNTAYYENITAVFEFPAYLDRYDYWEGFKGWAEIKCVDGCFNLL